MDGGPNARHPRESPHIQIRGQNSLQSEFISTPATACPNGTQTMLQFHTRDNEVDIVKFNINIKGKVEEIKLYGYVGYKTFANAMRSKQSIQSHAITYKNHQHSYILVAM